MNSDHENKLSHLYQLAALRLLAKQQGVDSFTFDRNVIEAEITQLLERKDHFSIMVVEDSVTITPNDMTLKDVMKSKK